MQSEAWGWRTGSSLGSLTPGSVTSSMSLLCKTRTTNADFQDLCKQQDQCLAHQWGSREPGGCHPAPGTSRSTTWGLGEAGSWWPLKFEGEAQICLGHTPLTPGHSAPPPQVRSPPWAVPCSQTLPHSLHSLVSVSAFPAGGCEQEWLNQDIIVFN